MAVPLFNLAPDLSVSRLCLGTMTFGEQNSMSESFRLLDHAFDAGINFFDSAEMYPVPQRADTQGLSEEYLGRWVRDRKIPRDRVVLATKTTSIFIKYIGPIGLYVPMFGEFEYDPTRQYSAVTVEEQLDALGRAVASGKIRYVGLSNETPYGVMKFLHVAERVPSYPKIVSVQNCYSLLCRTFDSGMAECCHHERISLLAYSPLAMGILSGKYFLPDGGPPDARLNLFKGRYSEGESRYNLSNSIITAAVMGYLKIADKYGLCPVALAIAFVLRHPLVASAIFGTTKRQQLQEVLDACNVELSPEIVAEINQIHANFPNPCP